MREPTASARLSIAHGEAVDNASRWGVPPLHPAQDSTLDPSTPRRRRRKRRGAGFSPLLDEQRRTARRRALRAERERWWLLVLWLLLQLTRTDQAALVIAFLSVSPISRAAGRSATAAAAYRLGIEIVDERTGERHDYTRRQGVEWSGVVGWKHSAAHLSNAIEAAEKRKDAKVARDVIVALPAESTPEQRRALAEGYAAWLFERHRTPCIVAIHAPGKDGDQRNWHAHILLATRASADGETLSTKKVRELDQKQTSGEHIEAWRTEWGRRIEMDMRSHARRGTRVEPEPKSPIPEERKAMRAQRAKVQTMRELIERAEIQLAGMAAAEIAEAETRERAARETAAQEQARTERARELRERELDLVELVDRARLPLPSWQQPVAREDLRRQILAQKHQAAEAAVQALPSWRRWWTALHTVEARELVRDAADWRAMTPAARSRLTELQAEHNSKAHDAQEKRLARVGDLELELMNVRAALAEIAPQPATPSAPPSHRNRDASSDAPDLDLVWRNSAPNTATEDEHGRERVQPHPRFGM